MTQACNEHDRSADGEAVAEQTRSERERLESALFALLVSEPRVWTFTELEAQLSPEPVLLVAVGNLADAGLLRWRGAHVVPTTAARRADELSV